MWRVNFAVALLSLAACAAAEGAVPTPSSNATATTSAASNAEEALRIFGVVALVMCGGMFSGLTLGIMGLDTNQLQVCACVRCPHVPRQDSWLAFRLFACHLLCDGCVGRHWRLSISTSFGVHMRWRGA